MRTHYSVIYQAANLIDVKRRTRKRNTVHDRGGGRDAQNQPRRPTGTGRRLTFLKLKGALSICLMQPALETRELDVDVPPRQAFVAALPRRRRCEPARKFSWAAHHR